MELTELVEFVEPSVVRIVTKGEYGGGLGSGFVVTDTGMIVTNYHVIEGSKSAEVTFKNGMKRPVLGFYRTDHQRDLALLKIDIRPGEVTPLKVARELPAKGTKVAAFGAPQGFSFSASDGIVSGLRSSEEVDQESGNWVQTTAAISPGNSGGPLVNLFGEVVGVNSFKRIDGESLNFAASCVDVRSLMDSAGSQLTVISPENIPVKIGGEFGNAENLAGTERGNLLFSQIREALVVIAPFNEDPTGRITDFVAVTAKRNILDKTGWDEIRRESQMKGSTAIVFAAMYFDFAEDLPLEDLVSELWVHLIIVARDVDKEGSEILAIVWDEKKAMGTVAVRALIQGIVPRTLQGNVNSFFSKFVTSYRKAVREVEK
jgi:hypothetical protein